MPSTKWSFFSFHTTTEQLLLLKLFVCNEYFNTFWHPLHLFFSLYTTMWTQKFCALENVEPLLRVSDFWRSVCPSGEWKQLWRLSWLWNEIQVLIPKKKLLINLYNGVLSSMTSVSWLILLPALLLAFYGGTDELDGKKNDQKDGCWTHLGTY